MILLLLMALIIRPQPGPQERFLSTSADVAITGGGAYGGKTYSIVLDPLRHVNNPKFGAVFFRRTMPQITNEGGLWDEAKNLYLPIGATSRTSPKHDFVFPSGAKITFSHMQLEDDRFDWDGSQIAAIYFDQLEHFEESQFWYMFSRNRSTCGVQPYIRATCNPDADSWLAKLLQWWWNPQTGYAIPERSGVIRWFIREKGEIIWADSREELKKKYPDSEPKSFTFIPSSIHDNKIALAKNPGALANLMALPLVEQERLLKGNWKIRLTAGTMFKRAVWEDQIRAVAPNNIVRYARYWDKAFTAGGGAYTVGALMAMTATGDFWVLDVYRGQWGNEIEPEKYRAWSNAVEVAAEQYGYDSDQHISALLSKPMGYRDRQIVETAESDRTKYGNVSVYLEHEPGSQGRDSVKVLKKYLNKFPVEGDAVKEDKVTRAKPYSSQHLARNVYLLEADWNEAFIAEHDGFPFAALKDQVDASSGAFNKLVNHEEPNWNNYGFDTVTADEDDEEQAEGSVVFE
jgi:predicted phage terminase large subunit-like protein